MIENNSTNICAILLFQVTCSTKVEHRDFGGGVYPHLSRVRGTTPTCWSGSLTIGWITKY